MKKPSHPLLRRFSRRSLFALAGVVILLGAARLALPFGLKWAINRRLEKVPAYEGRVDDVHVAIWRGAYQLRDVRIAKRGVAGDPFFAAKVIDCSLAWRELIHGKVVSDVRIEGARLNFIRGPSPDSSQLDVDRRWQEAIVDIFPIDITNLEISGSAIHYKNDAAVPAVDVFAEDVTVQVRGLRNRPSEGAGEFPATLLAHARTIGNAQLTVTAQAEPLAPKPHFELKVVLDQVNLPELNPFLRAYGKVDVSAGHFQLYLETAARDGRFEGYAKPFFSDVNFRDLADEGKGVGEKIWEALVSGLVKIFKNKPKDELAMRIPFAGEFGRTDIGVWATLTTMFRHGFIEALVPRLENSVKSADIPPAPKPLKPPVDESPKQ